MEARDALIAPTWDTLSIGKEAVLDKNWMQQQWTRSVREGTSRDCLSGMDFLHSPLGRGTYQISETVSRIRQTIEAAAAEGCEKGTLVLQSLVQGIRDICTMYGQMFPSLFRKEMEIPQLGLLSANDFFYLSSALLVLPFVVPNFKEMAPNTNFVQEAQELRSVGQRVMEKQVPCTADRFLCISVLHIQVAVQKKALCEILSQAGDFGHIKTGQQGIALRKSTQQLLRMLRQLGGVLKDVLCLSDRRRVAVSVTEVDIFHLTPA